MHAMEKLVSLFLRARISLGKKRFGDMLAPTVIRVSNSRIIKGPCELPELEALRYISKHTSIPVPKVHGIYHVGGRLYIEMDYVQGKTLQDTWPGLSLDKKQTIVEEVASFIEQLRLLKPTQQGIVASAEFKQSVDHRVGYKPFGPFSLHEFHDFLRGGLLLENCTETFGESVTRCHSRPYRTCFSHGDLCPRNIIVCNGKIAAIIDWEFSGWYPEYWEYTKAHYGLANTDWRDQFRSVVKRYDDELAAEQALWRWYDQPGDVTMQSVDENAVKGNGVENATLPYKQGHASKTL